MWNIIKRMIINNKKITISKAINLGKLMLQKPKRPIHHIFWWKCSVVKVLEGREERYRWWDFFPKRVSIDATGNKGEDFPKTLTNQVNNPISNTKPMDSWAQLWVGLHQFHNLSVQTSFYLHRRGTFNKNQINDLMGATKDNGCNQRPSKNFLRKN